MTRAISILALLALTLALASCGEKSEPEIGSTTAQAQFEIRGEWRGELHQAQMKPFPVQAAIVSLERFKQNTVHYGGLDCSGTWEYLGASESAYRFHEVIDRGRSAKCKGTGTVSLAPLSDDLVDYEFRGDGVVSRGQLTRVLPAKGG